MTAPLDAPEFWGGVTATAVAPLPEIIPGAGEWWADQIAAEADAFNSAACLRRYVSKPAFEFWHAAGCTDSGLWRGETRGMIEGEGWRPASPTEAGADIWTVPAMVAEDHGGMFLLSAIDLIGIDPATKGWRSMTGAAAMLPAESYGAELTYLRDPWTWLMLATGCNPQAVCFLNPAAPNAADLLRRGQFKTWTKADAVQLRGLRSKAEADAIKAARVSGTINGR